MIQPEGSRSAPGRPWIPLAALALALQAGCEAPDPVAPLAGEPWRFAAAAGALRSASCPPGTGAGAPQSLPIAATAVALEGADPAADLPGARYAGGWHLQQDEDRAFGGLSGLAYAGDEELLAVTDQGAFIWINLADGRPVAARLAPMRFAGGVVAADKTERDAEGLALRDGLALVSFEHEHRILAFDLAGCGAAALGVEVAGIGDRISGMATPMRPNGGAEGIALTRGGELLIAVEVNDDGLPIARLDASGSAVLLGRIAPRGRPVLTGIEIAGDTLYALLRDYLPGIGNTIEVLALPLTKTGPDFDAVRRVLRLEPRHGTDNFEGIALAPRADGGLRLWLIADDNFSARQRTLLYAFDLPQGAGSRSGL